ncbi:unnamed protein product [Rotaria magnacalcarata]|uniref:Uncharacterized protein n=1 Tax=Rotaria magnacalcarata TaxID=392030 RepID=A0A816S502_9BILA|nr:unnamed protein product [Rotaria magnacalcarata]
MTVKPGYRKDTANLLVEECLLIFTDDLFEVYSQLDPEGYIKYIPNTIDLVFISRLLHYEVDPSLYFQDIDIPEVCKSYISSNGRITLDSIVFYRKILHSTPPLELFTDVQCIQYKNNAQNKNLSLTLNAESQEKRITSIIDEFPRDTFDKTPLEKPSDLQNNSDCLLVNAKHPHSLY